MVRIRNKSIGISAILALTFSFAATGCGEGGGASTAIRLTAAERPDVTPDRSSSGVLHIPAEKPFNYPKFSSGQEGAESIGAAGPRASNGAFCRAEVNGEAKAWGSFQLGYGFDHVSTANSKCVVRVRLNATEKASDTAKDGEGAALPSGMVSLIFLLKDSNGLTLKEESLVSSSLRKGPREATVTHDFSFDAELMAERGYYLVVSGRAEAQTKSEGQTANVSLEISDIDIKLTWTEASPSSTSVSASDQ